MDSLIPNTCYHIFNHANNFENVFEENELIYSECDYQSRPEYREKHLKLTSQQYDT